MNNTTDKTINEKCSFQKFVQFRNSDLYISQQLQEENNKQGLLNSFIIQKYIPIDYYLDSIVNRYFYFTSPSEWTDPFETKYLEYMQRGMIYLQSSEERQTLNNMHIFCSCMTFNNSDNEEASWKSYGDNKEQIIRISYDFDKLCEILCDVNEKVYIGKMSYLPRRDILSPTPISPNFTIAEPFEAMYVNNFCLKQDAYQYEKELRFCIIKKGEQYNNLKSYKINNIDLSPAITKITLPPVNYKRLTIEETKSQKSELINKYLLLKGLHPKTPIHVSNLYDTDKIEMTSELQF